MEVTINNVHQDLLKLRKDIDLIKNILMSEGELTSWAKKQLIRARKEPEESYTSLNNL